MTTKTLELKAEDIQHYRDRHFVHLKGVLPTSLLEDCQRLLERWVDQKAAEWKAKGLLTDLHEGLDFRERFLHVWRDAGKPAHQRSPRWELAILNLDASWRILAHPALLDIAEALMESDDVCTHSIWNSRPKAPDAHFTDTPWHQDAQYFPKQGKNHIMTLWFPLHEVDADSSCLAVAPDLPHSEIYEPHTWEENGFLGLRRELTEGLEGEPIAMEPGDALCFTQLMPHRAMPNLTDKMRWSMDMRFVKTADADEDTLREGIHVRGGDTANWTRPEVWKQVIREKYGS